jgi:hypothetical protein
MAVADAQGTARVRRQSDLPIPTKEGGLPNDAQLDHEYNGSHDQATRRALYLVASEHRADISLSADVPRFIQEDLAISDVGRRSR